MHRYKDDFMDNLEKAVCVIYSAFSMEKICLIYPKRSYRLPLKDNFGIAMIGNYAVMNCVSYFFQPFFVYLGEIAYLNKRPEDIDDRKAKYLCFSDVTINENDSVLLLPCCLLVAESLFIVFSWKHGDKLQRCLA